MSTDTEFNLQYHNLTSNNVQIFETHEELIEKVSQESSTTWKFIPVLLHFIAALSGYAISIIFHTFWYDIFGGNCPIWASLQKLESRPILRYDRMPVLEESELIIDSDWRKNIMITFLYEWHCKYYHFISLCSCSFGVIWCMLFARCATGIYAAQWLIVPPALVFQTIFTILVYTAAHDFEHGYGNFNHDLRRIAYLSMNSSQIYQFKENCEIVDFYLQIFHNNQHNLCQVHNVLKILSWVMAWSWIGGLGYLILRIIVVHDFRLLQTVAYETNSKKVNDDKSIKNHIINNKVPIYPRKSSQQKPIYYLMAQT